MLDYYVLKIRNQPRFSEFVEDLAFVFSSVGLDQVRYVQGDVTKVAERVDPGSLLQRSPLVEELNSQVRVVDWLDLGLQVCNSAF